MSDPGERQGNTLLSGSNPQVVHTGGQWHYRLLPAPVFRALPHFRSRLSFEGSHKLGCHPAAIKPARLGENVYAIYKTFELRGVKCKVIAYCLKAWEGLGITPPHALKPLTGHRDGPIGGLPFPLAEGAARRAFDGVHSHIVRRNVKGWRAGGFQDPDGPRRPCNFYGSQANNHLPEIGGKARRPGIIPDGFLSRLRRNSKRWTLLSAIFPFSAVGFNPVLRGHSPLLFRYRCF